MLNWKIHTYIAGHFLYTDHSKSCPQASATGEITVYSSRKRWLFTENKNKSKSLNEKKNTW